MFTLPRVPTHSPNHPSIHPPRPPLPPRTNQKAIREHNFKFENIYTQEAVTSKYYLCVHTHIQHTKSSFLFPCFVFCHLYFNDFLLFYFLPFISLLFFCFYPPRFFIFLYTCTEPFFLPLCILPQYPVGAQREAKSSRYSKSQRVAVR